LILTSTSRFAFFSSENPNPFISLRGSKEPQGHPARAKTARQPIIRTAQNSKTTKRPIRPRSTQLLNYLPSARTPQDSFNSNLGLIRSAQTSRPVNRDPTLGLRSVFPNQPANPIQPIDQVRSSVALILTNLSRAFTSLQHRANQTQSPAKTSSSLELQHRLFTSYQRRAHLRLPENSNPLPPTQHQYC
jgi:hypothetical protein